MIRFSKDIIKLESVSSTNDFAKELLFGAIPATDITIIDTIEQTKGRGQRGNYWESEKGLNLIQSYIIKPTFLKPEQQFYISMSVSLAIVACLKPFTQNVSIKWPNDIFINNKKICGILIENTLLPESIQTTVVGIGININQTYFSPSTLNPTSLKIESDRAIDVDDVKTLLIENFDNYYTMLKNGDFDKIHKEYLSQLFLLNKRHLFKDKAGIFEGEITDVSTLGLLRIKNKDVITREYAFKEVDYLLI